MTTSDFLTIVSLLLAGLAILNSKERRLLLFKFGNRDIWIGTLLLIFLHYLISYDWIVTHWLHEKSIFNFSWGLPASTYAYLIAVGILGYLIYKIIRGRFATSKHAAVIEFYYELIEKAEIAELIDFIERYHYKDISSYLKGANSLPQPSEPDAIPPWTTSKKYKTARQNLLKQGENKLGALVWHKIVHNEKFVSMAASKYYRLFAELIVLDDVEDKGNEQFVQHYTYCLIEQQCQDFISELKELNDAHDAIVDRATHADLPIMFALFRNTKLAHLNEVWQPIQKVVMASMDYDEKQKRFLKTSYEERLEDELWKQKIQQGIVFFNYMVRECIRRDSDWHMWLYGYHRFVQKLITNLEADAVDARNSSHSFNHYLIHEIVRNICGWLELTADINESDLYIDICKCLSDIKLEIANCPYEKMGHLIKVENYDSILRCYFDLSNHENQEKATTVRNEMEQMFTNLDLQGREHISLTDAYCVLLSEAWQRFDEVPYYNFQDNSTITQFERNVLIELGIEP